MAYPFPTPRVYLNAFEHGGIPDASKAAVINAICNHCIQDLWDVACPPQFRAQVEHIPVDFVIVINDNLLHDPALGDYVTGVVYAETNRDGNHIPLPADQVTLTELVWRGVPGVQGPSETMRFYLNPPPGSMNGVRLAGTHQDDQAPGTHDGPPWLQVDRLLTTQQRDAIRGLRNLATMVAALAPPPPPLSPHSVGHPPHGDGDQGGGGGGGSRSTHVILGTANGVSPMRTH